MNATDMIGHSLAIIPARSGSKRIPRKNIRSFRGKPIIGWSLEAALRSEAFDEVMVSTDDAEIAEAALAFGAEVPFLRSAEASDDQATTADVLQEVLATYAALGRGFSIACCIYPTAPFVTPEALVAGKAELVESLFDVIMPVAPFPYPIWRSLRREATGRIGLNFPEHLKARSQDLSPAYHDAGQWYWFRVPAFMRDGSLMGSNTGSVLLSPTKVQDIDTEEDWEIAEIKHEKVFG